MNEFDVTIDDKGVGTIRLNGQDIKFVSSFSLEEKAGVGWPSYSEVTLVVSCKKVTINMDKRKVKSIEHD